jgi:putative hydrolase of the HAD superfamily
MSSSREQSCILFDWGETLMRVFPEYDGPMVTWPQVEAMPHAEQVLAELQPLSILSVATNAADSDEAEIRAALDRVGLDKLLDKVYCYRKIGHKKPSKEFFDYILSDLGIERSHVLMVGDDFDADVMGANNCGIRAIWYNPRTEENRESSMHMTIHDLRQLRNAVTNYWGPINESEEKEIATDIEPKVKFLQPPRTRLGWWAVGLSILFVVLFVGVSNRLILFSGFLTMVLGVIAGILDLLAILWKRERSWLLWVMLLPGLFAILFAAGEILYPH